MCAFISSARQRSVHGGRGTITPPRVRSGICLPRRVLPAPYSSFQLCWRTISPEHFNSSGLTEKGRSQEYGWEALIEWNPAFQKQSQPPGLCNDPLAACIGCISEHGSGLSDLCPSSSPRLKLIFLLLEHAAHFNKRISGVTSDKHHHLS